MRYFLFRYWECKFNALIERLCFWFCKYFHTISPLPPPVSDLRMFATIYHVHLSRRNTYHAKCDMFYNTAASNPYLMHFHICNLPKFDRSLYFLTGIQYFRWIKFSETLLFKGYLLIVFRVINRGSQGMYLSNFLLVGGLRTCQMSMGKKCLVFDTSEFWIQLFVSNSSYLYCT